ncbi:MAG: hypothetical protein FRX49_05185 [Trebouxia sp. A1-2]|nr:MAG: hypothetical protein FRX49_05185 [Trebouxia sp. A1-2]
MTAPSNFIRASSSISLEGMSKWLVGSSSTSKGLDVIQLGIRRGLHHGLQHVLLQVQSVCLVLSKVGGHNVVGAQLYSATDGLLLTHDEAQQGALATAIGACRHTRVCGEGKIGGRRKGGGLECGRRGQGRGLTNEGNSFALLHLKVTVLEQRPVLVVKCAFKREPSTLQQPSLYDMFWQKMHRGGRYALLCLYQLVTELIQEFSVVGDDHHGHVLALQIPCTMKQTDGVNPSSGIILSMFLSRRVMSRCSIRALLPFLAFAWWTTGSTLHTFTLDNKTILAS